MNIENLKNKKIAVIIVDMQNDYCHEDGIMSKLGFGTKNIQSAVKKTEMFLKIMRENKVPIIHVQMTEDRNKIAENIKRKRIEIFGEAEKWELAVPETWGHELIFGAEQNELIFEKNSYDAFSNQEMKNHLQSMGIETLIIIGGYTHVCVESTVRSAVTHGFDVIILKDLVASLDIQQELHKNSIKVMGALFASVLDSEEFENFLLYGKV